MCTVANLNEYSDASSQVRRSSSGMHSERRPLFLYVSAEPMFISLSSVTTTLFLSQISFAKSETKVVKIAAADQSCNKETGDYRGGQTTAWTSFQVSFRVCFKENFQREKQEKK